MSSKKICALCPGKDAEIKNLEEQLLAALNQVYIGEKKIEKLEKVSR